MSKLNLVRIIVVYMLNIWYKNQQIYMKFSTSKYYLNYNLNYIMFSKILWTNLLPIMC